MSIRGFGAKLRTARRQKGISQRGLSLALGLSDKTISSYESSRSYPTIEVLSKMAEILDKPVEYFTSSSKRILLKEHMRRVEIKQSEIGRDIKKILNILKREE